MIVAKMIKYSIYLTIFKGLSVETLTEAVR